MPFGMSEMIDRVAAALSQPDRDQARAVIEAMREPTPAMVEALFGPDDDQTGRTVQRSPDEIAFIWRVMIDAALTPHSA